MCIRDREKKLAGSKILKKGKSKKFTAKLDHLSSNTYRFTPKGGSKLQLAISGPAKAAGTRAVVTVYKGSKAKQKYLAISAKGRGGITVKLKGVDAVEVTLVNASIRYTRCFPPSNYSPFACGGKPTDQKKALSVFGKVV